MREDLAALSFFLNCVMWFVLGFMVGRDNPRKV